MLLRTLIVVAILIANLCTAADKHIIIDQRDKTPYVFEEQVIDTVWAAHPVGFFLMTEGNRQFIAYYNADRNMITASRDIGDKQWTKFAPQTNYKKMPSTDSPASCKLGWDSHNYLTMAIDSEGFIHLSGNMHCNNLTYFRSSKPYDITTLKQVKQMTCKLEKRCTYPEFMKKPNGELIFKYRTGSSGNGNQIYNIYDVENKKWSRLLDKPLTDGNGKRNAYFQGPVLGPDNMYHVSWVWRETYDCSTNHDLSYAKSADLLNWQTVDGKKLKLPITLETDGVIVDPIPVKGGIINGCGKIGFDNDDNMVMTYHKFDEKGKTQAYCARATGGKWQIKELTDWDYRWYFEGGGSIVFEVRLGNVSPLQDEYLQLGYGHKKHGSGTWLLDNDLNICGKVYKSSEFPKSINKVVSDFPEMRIKRTADAANTTNNDIKYFLKWETLGQNRDLERTGKLPQPSNLILYGIKYK